MSVPLRSLPLHAVVRHLPLTLPRRAVTRSVAAENRQVPQGPCGVAFLGDTSLGAYTLLLYKSQENHLARVPFTDQFKLESTVSGKSTRAAGNRCHRPNAGCTVHKNVAPPARSFNVCCVPQVNGLYVTLYNTTAGQAGVWTLLFQTEDEVKTCDDVSLPVLPQPPRHGNVTQELQFHTVGLPVVHCLAVIVGTGAAVCSRYGTREVRRDGRPGADRTLDTDCRHARWHW